MEGTCPSPTGAAPHPPTIRYEVLNQMSTKDAGPIPEGVYTARQDDFQRWEDTSIFNRAACILRLINIKAGRWPGCTTALGNPAHWVAATPGNKRLWPKQFHDPRRKLPWLCRLHRPHQLNEFLCQGVFVLCQRHGTGSSLLRLSVPASSVSSPW
ncbi:hypothetical protein CNECB9_5340023 [Cupriavidus necator]|uniref:Uncharacterized protein n=1 Tax=Cupriavidus necator TaxID=106590 RepID=A0A1K0JX49_CUPNE|nr:hypothetical protein CNECB9_5340023 [Cupriavidus necator]